jgi:flagellar assembly protein FliH
MSSWSEASVVRAREHAASAEEVEGASGRGTRPEPRSGVVVEPAWDLAPLATPELRTGEWTRFGASSVLGDTVTEETLSALAERTRTAARSQGYSVGWAEGQRAAREEARRHAAAAADELARAEDRRATEHRAAVAALEAAAAHLHDTVASLSATVEEHASELAWELTEALVGHELRSATGADVVRRALQLAPTEPVARLRLHPDQLAGLGAADLAELAERGVEAVADPGLGWADALVEAADHVIDARIGTALDRVREVLS